MERYAMFMNWKNKYCQDDSTNQGNLKIQINPIRLPMAFSTILEQNISKSVWRHKIPQIAKAILF